MTSLNSWILESCTYFHLWFEQNWKSIGMYNESDVISFVLLLSLSYKCHFYLGVILVRVKLQPYDIATNISYIPKYYFTIDFATSYVL